MHTAECFNQSPNYELYLSDDTSVLTKSTTYCRRFYQIFGQYRERILNLVSVDNGLREYPVLIAEAVAVGREREGGH